MYYDSFIHLSAGWRTCSSTRKPPNGQVAKPGKRTAERLAGRTSLSKTYQPVGAVFGKRSVMTMVKSESSAKTKILDAALSVIRAKGYSATTVDDICQASGVTKGAFFHHFKSKEDLAVSAAGHFSSMAKGLFATAGYENLPDPLDRLLGYVDFRKATLRGELPEFTCLLGTMVQEAYETHPRIREACDAAISEHAAVIESDIAEAIRKYRIDAEWTAKSLALYTQAVMQGAFILAKAKHGPEVAADCLDHLRRYLEMLFRSTKTKGETSCQLQH